MPRTVPPGDLAVWLPALARRLPVDAADLRRRKADALANGRDFAARRTRSTLRHLGRSASRSERGLRALPTIGGIFAGVMLFLLASAFAG